MDLFTSKQPAAEVAIKTAASKLSNGAALIIDDLTQEPAKGLLHVSAHVQKSVPVLLDTHQGLQAAAAKLQAALAELQDAQEGVMSITSPTTQQELTDLAASVVTMQQLAQQQQQRLLLQHQDASAGSSRQQAVQSTDGIMGGTSSGSMLSSIWRGRPASTS